MLALARERLAGFQQSSFFVEDGQALGFPDQSFDSVICNMGLMYFPDPEKGVREFYRVLRNNGRATVSVFHGSGAVYRLSSGREFEGVGTLIAARDPSGARHGGDFRKVGARVADLFAKAGFREIESQVYSGLLVMPNLDGYVQGIEAGAGSAGAEFLAVASEVREAVRAELHDLVREANREEVKVIVPVMFATGCAERTLPRACRRHPADGERVNCRLGGSVADFGLAGTRAGKIRPAQPMARKGTACPGKARPARHVLSRLDMAWPREAVAAMGGGRFCGSRLWCG
jgi:hypothetical protein